MGLAFLYLHHHGSMQGKGVMHGVNWVSVGNDRMVRMVSLYLYSKYILMFYLVSLGENESERSFRFTYPLV